MRKTWLVGFALLAMIGVAASAMAWTPKPVKEDQLVFMPGSQPGDSGNMEGPNRCLNCHTEPIGAWYGSMMGQAARDPLWLACLTTADQDSIWAVGNPNAGDICTRCHSPMGWLGGRSEPTNTSALTGDDFHGVQCDFCHRMVDPMVEAGQPDVAPDTGTALTLANDTYAQDLSYLAGLLLFDGTSFLGVDNFPTRYGPWPAWDKGVSGQYFVDSNSAKRGPFADAPARHQWLYSRFHKSQNFCHTCHDVSNPILASVTMGLDVTERQVASSFFHVERTSSEFMLSAYADGAATDIPGVPVANKCQDCHMRDITGVGCNKKGVPVRDDLPLHDLTGGNSWISGILSTVDQAGPAYDPYNYEILSGAKYPGATIDVAGLQGLGIALADGSSRAVQQLEMAATLIPVAEDASSFTLRVRNNGGHKLISGFPEGRRMFLSVDFYDGSGEVIAQINPYEPLVTTLDGAGNEVYVSGGDLFVTDDELVWETKMSSALTGEEKTFHFALATDRYKDNRIPPRGFDTGAAMFERIVQPRWHGADAPDYFTAAEYAGGYDEVTILKPAGAVSWYATLNYQTTSKDYIEFLRDEINGTATTLYEPTYAQNNGLNPDADAAYLVQTDPFFSNLRGWGDAIWDLWLHNGGSAPVLMTALGDAPTPPCLPPATAPSLTATGAKRSMSLSWTSVTGAVSYNIYLDQSGKYTFLDSTTQTSYTDRNVTIGQTYCYAVTAVSDCGAETTYSNTDCGVPVRR